jgi:hypothetical protein
VPRSRPARRRSSTVRLNAAAALLFGRRLPVERYILHETQLTGPMTLDEAASEVGTWN